jgi:3-oxoadipate enol-lactonase
MPMIEVDGCPLYVEVEGRDDAPVLMLSNSLGTDLHMWTPQAKPFAERFRLLRYDRRGHGKSGVPSGPYSMERLGRDVLGILDHLHIEAVDWCGLSMGGMVGQWLGANAPGRIRRLLLANTSSWFPVKEPWNERIAVVRERGMAAIADATMARWFTAPFIAREPDAIAQMKAMVLATPAAGYVANCEAVRDMDHRDILRAIKAPTLLIAGRHDVATPVEAAEFIRDRITGAALTLLEAGHISNIEQASDFTATVLDFLAAH